MEVENEFMIRRFLRFWYMTPIIGSIIFNIYAYIEVSWSWYNFPFSVAYPIFGLIYFMSIRKKIIFQRDYLTLHKGFKTIYIDYENIESMKEKIVNNKRGPLFIFSYHKNDKRKKIKFEIEEFGGDYVKEIASLLKQKNNQVTIELYSY